MKVISKEELKKVFKLHLRYLKDDLGGQRADLSGTDLSRTNLSRTNLSGTNLSGANLSGANLSGTNLSGTNLSGADLSGATLSKANLSKAHLSGANLSGAYLFSANLSGVDLSGANLSGTNLSGADLSGATLSGANLSGANLSGVDLSEKQIEIVLTTRTIVPERGSFIGYKKLKKGYIATLLVPKSAMRMGGLVGRKCRANKAKVLEIAPLATKPDLVFYDSHTGKLEYKIGKWVYPDKYDPNPLIECSNGIHFFITKQEALDY